MDIVTAAVAVTGSVATAAVAGVFFAFSTFVVDGLDNSGRPHAAVAMRSINASAVRAPFMTLLFGTAGLTGAIAVHELRSFGPGLATTAAAIYWVSVVGVTVVANVPLNERLRTADGTTLASGAAWDRFARPWLRWNHLRAGGALAASICLAAVAGR